MFSTENKISTLRIAKAQAVLQLTEELCEILKSRKSPKGDALEIARTAGIMAAKKTWEFIPFCHPLPLDQVAIEYTFEKEKVIILATVTAIWKTGVEMEALIAAQITATVLFDMLKPISTAMSITDIKVVEKRGGKTSFIDKVPPNFKVAVLVSSDGTFQGKRKDRSGLLIKEKLESLKIPVKEYLILPDEKEEIRNALLRFHEEGYQLVITTGGTGLGPRDVTVEATRMVIDREIPGIMESARGFGQNRTPYAMLARGIAGQKGKMVIINLPGSSRGTQESLHAILPGLLHAYPMMEGGGHG